MMLLHLSLCFLALVNLGHLAPSPIGETAEKLERAVDYRLPENVWPSYYRIQLTPYLLATDQNRFTFDGVVEITLLTNQNNLWNITLHARDLQIKSTEIRKKDNDTLLEIHEVTPADPVTNKFNVNLNFPLQPNVNYILKFTYSGIMGDDMHGFYKSKYTNAKGEEVWIGSTQFQTHHARRAFPSFDEPKFKARFKIDVTHPMNFEVISNTLEENKIRVPAIQRSITVFKETPIMSTYLVAFIISDFKARGNDTYTILARPEAYDQTEYAYNITPHLLASLNEFTDYNYNDHGLGKLFLAGIPDFSAGAMENWGLLTYRETALLYDPKVSTLLNQQRVASVISHELAHQWFGDLVTCDWWGYTWLNEGFGRYFQYFTTHAVEPKWGLDQQFVVEQIHSVMNMDSLPGATTMSDRNASSPSDLSRMFNSISYNKGATILRMIEHLMTPTKFRNALRGYLRERAFKTSIPQNLFDAFSKEWTGDISSLLRDWTEQVGYPVVTISLASDGKSFTAKQKRFTLRDDTPDAGNLYQIPFTYTTDAELDFGTTTSKTTLAKTSQETTITLSKPAKWVIANIQQVGYYRVNYDEMTWKHIREALATDQYGRIHEINRAQLMDDVFNFARAGIVKYETLVDIVSYLKSETHYIPWYAAFQGFNYLTIRLGKENQRYFRTYILDLLQMVYKQVQFTYEPTEDRLVTYNRNNILSWACRFEHEDCIKNSVKLFQTFMNQTTPVEVNIRTVVYCTAIRNGGELEFNFLWEKYLKENVATEQVLILNSLACTKDKNQLVKYLNIILTDSVRLQDRLNTFTATYTSNVENVDTVWEFVHDNYPAMIKSFGSSSTVASIISGIAGRFTTQNQRDALQAFINDHKNDFESSATTLTNALTSVDFNLNWAKNSMQPFVEHLKSVGDSATSVTVSTVLLIVAAYMAFLLS